MAKISYTGALARFFLSLASTPNQLKSLTNPQPDVFKTLTFCSHCGMNIFTPSKLSFFRFPSRTLSCMLNESRTARRSLHSIRRGYPMAATNMNGLQGCETNGRPTNTAYPPYLSNTTRRRMNATSSLEGPSASPSQVTRAYIALGSNVGNRLEMIERACKALSDDPDIVLTRTSCLYETEPMYVEDQARFLNGACEPMDLLDRLQGIENTLGRVKLIDKGPRSIDLDILLYGDQVIETERLKIPHALMHEREFVLRPLCDMISHVKPPRSSSSFRQSLQKLPPGPTVTSSIIQASPQLPIYALNPKRPTHVMSILNVTPDSFSDGGANVPTDEAALRSTIIAHIRAGATIIDIGGQSSRPGAPDISAQEEIERVLPAVRIIKSLPEASHVAISIDTYRAAVAEAAVGEGAHIINDISAGLLDPEMLPTVARLGCTVCLMHMRGTPATMTSKENCTYPDGVIPTVAKELLERVDAAEKAGIRRWRIMLDPGVGFAKTLEQNLEILRRMQDLRLHEGLVGFPWLLGTSRKGFIGKITGVKEARERAWGTAATVSAVVQGGADIVRVHDVDEMAKVVKMSDAIWRV